VMADDAFFAAQARRLAPRPFIFQQYVGGRSYRAYLLGGRVVSAGEILHDRAHVDWRERSRGATTVDLEPRLEEELARAVRLLDLPCAGVDIELDAPSGIYYLLDFNPSALFVGWGRMCGADVAAMIADYLLELAHGGRVWRDGRLDTGAPG